MLYLKWKSPWSQCHRIKKGPSRDPFVASETQEPSTSPIIIVPVSSQLENLSLSSNANTKQRGEWTKCALPISNVPYPSSHQCWSHSAPSWRPFLLTYQQSNTDPKEYPKPSAPTTWIHRKKRSFMVTSWLLVGNPALNAEWKVLASAFPWYWVMVDMIKILKRILSSNRIMSTVTSWSRESQSEPFTPFLPPLLHTFHNFKSYQYQITCCDL